MIRSQHYWRNLALFTVLVILIGTVSGGVWLAHARAMALVHPARLVSSRTPTDQGIANWENISFTTSDGLELKGWFIPPDPRNRAAFVFAHGLGNDRTELLDEAAMLARHGYGALLIDLRNHGASQGTITTLGFLEVEDIRGAVAYLSGRSEVDLHRIGLLGHSMGAATVLRAAARISTARVVIAESAYTSLADNIAEGVQGLIGLPPIPFAPLLIWFGERETGMNIQQVRPIDDMPQISPRGVMLIHGAQDPIVPVRNAQQLYQAAREPKQIYIVPNAGHNFLFAANPQEFEIQVIDFITRADVLGK